MRRKWDVDMKIGMLANDFFFRIEGVGWEAK